MDRALLAVAIAGCIGGCSFRSPGSSADSADAPAAGADAQVADAPLSDASGFDPATCPQTYTTSLASFPRARYRIITTNAVLDNQLTQCTVAGLSHLVVLESAAELTELGRALQQVPSQPDRGWYYAGAVQKRGQTAAGAEWWWLTGGAISPAIWGTLTTGVQPNDANGIENNEENVVTIDVAQAKLMDVTGTIAYGAVCECDGKSMDATLASELP